LECSGLTSLSDGLEVVEIAETLEAMSDLVKGGKVRHIGVSNESPWGLSEYLRLHREAEQHWIASIQNAYNLLNRTFESGLSEFALHEEVSLLPYSPLGGGNLSGKYLGGVIPPGSRRAVAKQFTRHDLPRQARASARNLAIATAHVLHPWELALALVNRQPFVTSTIIGATSLEQLAQNIASIDVALSDETLRAIKAVHRELPDHCT
jgi:aryl-alcohol dehydrogenase-like predicted oxidoreductase